MRGALQVGARDGDLRPRREGCGAKASAGTWHLYMYVWDSFIHVSIHLFIHPSMYTCICSVICTRDRYTTVSQRWWPQSARRYVAFIYVCMGFIHSYIYSSIHPFMHPSIYTCMRCVICARNGDLRPSRKCGGAKASAGARSSFSHLCNYPPG